MFVVSDNILCVSSYRTVNKLVIIRISCYQPKMEIGLLKEGCAQPGYSLNNTMTNFLCGLFRQNLFVLIQNLSVDT